MPPPIANTAPPFDLLRSDTESLKFSATSATSPLTLLGVGIVSIELVISLPVPNTNEPLLFCVLFAIPTTLLATPDTFPNIVSNIELSLEFDSILFNVPTVMDPKFCAEYKDPKIPEVLPYLVVVILYEPILVDKLPLIYELEPIDVSPTPIAS